MKLLAIDGNSIINRAFYGVRPLSTKDGFPTNALYGMVTMISRQAELLNPDYLAVAFDLKAPTFRHKAYAEYKAGRTPNPDVLCNREIKFKDFKQKALELGADYIATGHYAKVEYDEELKRYTLKAARDTQKDQTYFLYSLTQDNIRLSIKSSFLT